MRLAEEFVLESMHQEIMDKISQLSDEMIETAKEKYESKATN